ncbi:hypothetical protein C8P68_10151 [Mucilaginibacter yixingensis]|uniref:Uncharacterized protein n=1 Tax=Mucilaginibacter yixingensis TaxID=1295612 RepID=A0A2T5JEL2_9SPHI|nr:hypothetical protein [Mucilaginibacter yixingensis]PTR00824.1 hypothetical protein C8P68_10151 [Mucilaginibacter yixingensis]
MDTLRIDILNPKAKKLLKDLADLDLIAIRKEKPKEDLKAFLKRLRANEETAPSLEEITAEVEAVRAERYAKSK